jgi:D-psicose/D-tagatose/L-ribulose 3-epimerase
MCEYRPIQAKGVGRMKAGMNLLLWTAHVDDTHSPLLTELAEAGFDGVEIPLFEGDATHFRGVRAELDRAGLACTTVTVASVAANAVSPDPAVREAFLERIRWAAEMSEILGSRLLCGPMHQALGEFTGTGPTAAEKGRAAETLHAAAEIAGAAGVTLAVEYLNRFESYFLTTAADAVALVEAVGHPRLRTMHDTFHAHIEEKSQAAAIGAVAPVMAHFHVSENDRGVPGSGQVRFDEAFATLRALDYDGWITIEAFGSALPDLAAATCIWRPLFEREEDVYRDGLALIRSGLA